MPLTYIDTNLLAPATLPGSGEFVEILNNELCGAKNVVATLRWLHNGEKLEAISDGDHHQLIYLMEGEATITLDSQNQDVNKGAGVYLGPSETATVKQRGAAPMKLFHIVVPKIPK